MSSYTKHFYKYHREGSRQSAREIVPLILELIQPERVIDVGCGAGIWLSVFQEYGVEDVWGIDGDWVDTRMLQIPEERFFPFDLKKPFQLDKQFDVVMSLEVAEHLPGECAATFVDSLTRLGPVVLFSAAIPFQRGTHHLNEQWPDYWARHFQEKGYVAIDCIRKKIWQNDDVEWWYAQNILMFVRQNYLESHPVLKKEFEYTNPSQLSIIHPKLYLTLSDPQRICRLCLSRRVLSAFPLFIKDTLRKRLKVFLKE